jgi:hypothetical protein
MFLGHGASNPLKPIIKDIKYKEEEIKILRC